MNQTQFKVIDLFCGAGGVTTGVHKARVKRQRIAEVVACINHDPLAIESHQYNHPNTLHFSEDITTFDEHKLPVLGDNGILWASIECTNFSKAKGGKPRNADSRTLAEHLPRYILHTDPDYVIIENVEEFLAWGDLDEKGKPISRLNGRLYEKWKRGIEAMGYEYEYRFLNAADFGAFTSRKRYFGIFARYGLKISFPKPTHDKKGRFGLHKWRAVKSKLDLKNEGNSIFNRKKPLSPNTIKRIEYGIRKFVIGEAKANFLIKYYCSGHNTADIENPAPTIMTSDRVGLVSAEVDKENFMLYTYGREDAAGSIENPSNVVRTNNNQRLITVEVDKKNFINSQYTSGGFAKSTDEPLNAITGTNHHSIVSIETHEKNFISPQYGFKENHNKSIEEPLGIITTGNKQMLVSIEEGQNKHFIAKVQYGEKSVSPIDKPSPTLLTRNNFTLISVEEDKEKVQFLHKYYGNEGNYNTNTKSLDEPCPVITPQVRTTVVSADVDAEKKKQFLTKYYSGNHAASIETPSPTITTQGDHIGLITVLMNLGVIKDIKMRFLTVEELKTITGFRKDYKLCGNQSDQKKFIGNAVVPKVAEVIIEELWRVRYSDEQKNNINTPLFGKAV